MTKSSFHFLLYTLSTLLLLAVHVLASATNETEAPTEAPTNDALLCKVALHVLEAGGTSGSPSAEFFGCMLVDEQTGSVSPFMYILEGLPNILQQQCRSRLVANEVVYLSILGGQLTDTSVVTSDPSLIEILTGDYQSKSLRSGTMQYSQKSIGTLKVLVLRIIALDSQPTFSADQLNNYIFTDDISLKGQMSKCSAGKLTIEPTLYGVLDVPINMNINGLNYVDVTNAALAAAPSYVSENVQDVQDLADAVMMVVPPGTQDSWQGYGGVNGKQTTFNDMWAAYVGAQMHEIGHNLGLLHSNENGQEYADVTGYMGRAAQVLHYPQKCYNGQNHWYLGWFADRSLEVDVFQNGQQLLSIASFVDYPKAKEGQYVVVKIGDYYLQYNRQTSFNEDTGDDSDMLTIVKYEDGVGTDLVAGLNPGTPPWNSGDYQMVLVDVCQTVPGTDVDPDIMIVSVGVGESACPSVVATNSPTRSPTSAPIVKPSVNIPGSSPANLTLAPVPNVDNQNQQPVPSPAYASPQTAPSTNKPTITPRIPEVVQPAPTKQPQKIFVGIPQTVAPTEKPAKKNPFVGIPANPTLNKLPTFSPQVQEKPAFKATYEPSVQPKIEKPVVGVVGSPTVPSLSPQEKPSMATIQPTRQPTTKSPFGGIPGSPTVLNTTTLSPQIQEKPSSQATPAPSARPNKVLYNIPDFPTLVSSPGDPPSRRLMRSEDHVKNRSKPGLEFAIIVISAIMVGVSAFVFFLRKTNMSSRSICATWAKIGEFPATCRDEECVVDSLVANDKTLAENLQVTNGKASIHTRSWTRFYGSAQQVYISSTTRAQPLLCEYTSDVEDNQGGNLEAANNNLHSVDRSTITGHPNAMLFCQS